MTEMRKAWIHNLDGTFSLYDKEIEIGTLIKGDDWTKKPTTFNIHSENYKIENRFGLFRRSTNRITNGCGENIVELKTSFNQNFKYQNRRLQLTFSNTPFWKWTIMEGEKILTSYEITLSHPELGPNIQCSKKEFENYMFDFILGNFTLGRTQKDFH